MSYLDELKKIKKLFGHDIITFYLDGQKITLSISKNKDKEISLISDWRDKFCNAYHSKFKVTNEGTKRWLDSFMLDPDKLLFLIYINDDFVGHIGCDSYDQNTNSATQGYLVRGNNEVACKGLMEAVSKGMTYFMFDRLKLEQIKVGFWSDNFKPINLYLSKLGFLIRGIKEFEKCINDDGWVYKQVGNEFYQNLKSFDNHRVYLESVINKERFYNLNKAEFNRFTFQDI